jgi:hypothetical protein
MTPKQRLQPPIRDKKSKKNTLDLTEKPNEEQKK